MPKVSVIIGIYNPPRKHLHESLESVFSQTFQDFEVIVVDDGSSIDTQEILQPYKNRIRYYYKENGGVNTARLLGLGKAQGKFIALIDQDDIWPPEKLKKQVEFLENYPELDFIFSDFHNFSEDGFYPKTFLDSNEIFRTIPTEKVSNVSSKAYIFPNNILFDYLRGNFLLQGTFMAEKNMCEKYKMFITKINGREFYEFGLRTFHLFKVGFIDEVLLYRRIHGNNVVLNFELWQKNTLAICEEALKYPWMDAECKKFLNDEVIKSHFNLGRYYFHQDDFIEARKHFKTVMARNPSHPQVIFRWLLTFIPSKSMVLQGKALWNRLKTFQ